MPAVAKTLKDDPASDICEKAIKTLDPVASGVFSVEMKQDHHDVSNITDVNAGRFALITNFYNFTGTRSMAQGPVSLALGRSPDIPESRDFAAEHYLGCGQDNLPWCWVGLDEGRAIVRRVEGKEMHLLR